MMSYRLFGWWIRWQACKMAAQVLQGNSPDAKIAPQVWSLAVFFESYMTEGADGTMADFGPKSAELVSIKPEVKID